MIALVVGSEGAVERLLHTAGPRASVAPDALLRDLREQRHGGGAGGGRASKLSHLRSKAGGTSQLLANDRGQTGGHLDLAASLDHVHGQERGLRVALARAHCSDEVGGAFGARLDSYGLLVVEHLDSSSVHGRDRGAVIDVLDDLLRLSAALDGEHRRGVGRPEGRRKLSACSLGIGVLLMPSEGHCTWNKGEKKKST